MDIIRTEKDDKHFWAKYYLESENLYDAAWELAVGQSIGNPNARSVWETPQMIEDHAAKIIFDGAAPENRKRGHVWIGFPYVNIDWTQDGVSQLMCFLMGGQLDIDNIKRCHLLELDIDVSRTGFLGPRHGLAGFRKFTMVYDRPLVGGIIKPKTGITPDQLLDMTKQLVDGGMDFIKEDEILGNPQVCPLIPRVELIADYLYKSGAKTIFCHCINGDSWYAIDKAMQVWCRGGNGVHLNVWSGLGTYRILRESADQVRNPNGNPLFIHYQKSGDRIITNPKHAFHISWSVLCQLAGMCGVDTIHAGMIGGYYNKDAEKETLDALVELRKFDVTPALSCGMNPFLVQPIVDKIGIDWLANTGGFIHSDPKGSRHGAERMRLAAEACRIQPSLGAMDPSILDELGL